MKTKFTELTGAKYPIMQGGMMRIGNAELAAAVSNAGGLGTITAGNYPTGDDLRKGIELCKTLTKNPFAVNLTFILAGTPPPFDDYIDVISHSMCICRCVTGCNTFKAQQTNVLT